MDADDELSMLRRQVEQYRSSITVSRMPKEHAEREEYEHESGYLYTISHSIRSLGSHIRLKLPNRSLSPSLQRFALIISSMIAEIYDTTPYEVRNVTFGYVCGDNRTMHLSIPQREIDEKGWDDVMKHVESGDSSDLFEDYEGLRTTANDAVVDTSVLCLHIREKYIGGCGDPQGDAHRNDDCLIGCFNSITERDVEPSHLREHLGIADGELSIACIPVLEAHYGVTVTVYSYDHGLDIMVAIYRGKKRSFPIMLNDHHYSVMEAHPQSQSCESNERVPDAGMQKPCYYYFFDFETVWEPGTLEMIPYAYSILVSDDTGKVLETRTRIGNPGGRDVCEDFMDYIVRNSPGDDCVKYLVGYNNARFDNYILVNAASGYNIRFGNEVVAGRSILFMTLCGFRVKDLYRFTGGSLAHACRDFGCKVSKLDFDHTSAQNAYMANSFDRFLENSHADVVEYCARDVSCLAELYFIARTSIALATGMDIDKEMTLPSLAYKALKRSLKHTGRLDVGEIPILEHNMDRYVRQALIGGRSQVFSPGIHTDVTIVDRVSQYPYVMLNNPFPIGKPINTCKYIDNRIGVYKVVIHNQPVIPIVPERHETLIWDTHRRPMGTWITSVEMRTLMEEHCVVDVVEGVYWPKQSYGLFDGFLIPILDEKERQDRFKELGSTDYNAGIRECMKRLANCLSGKLIQRTHMTVRRVIKSRRELQKIFESIIHETIDWSCTSGGADFVTATKAKPKPTVPTIWGMLIYAYARRDVYRDLLKRSMSKIVTDTDSLMLSTSEYKLLHSSSPHLFGNEIGKLRTEATGINVIAVAPKCYCVYEEIDGVKTILKRAFKGVDVHNDVVITNPRLISKVRSGALSVGEMHMMYTQTTIAEGVKGVGIQTYMSMALGEEVYILSTSIRRDRDCRLRLRHSYVTKVICAQKGEASLI